MNKGITSGSDKPNKHLPCNLQTPPSTPKSKHPRFVLTHKIPLHSFHTYTDPSAGFYELKQSNIPSKQPKTQPNQPMPPYWSYYE